jgi:predicted deacetylase
MSSEGPTYLLRLDDICPTMNWKVWNRIEAALLAHDIRPIVAVVPDNQDPKLVVGPRANDFWERVRQWQSRKWSIAMHGYQHRYVNNNGGILKLSNKSEFAGLPKCEQERKLRAGVAKFQEMGVCANAWVAPSHSFDETTVQLLPEVGIRIISDGLSVLPFEGENNVIWIPQQLWDFQRRNHGVWTICFHFNEWNDAMCDRFCEQIEAFRPNIKTLDEVVGRWPGRTPDMRDRLHELIFRVRIRLRTHVNAVRRGLRFSKRPVRVALTDDAAKKVISGKTNPDAP